MRMYKKTSIILAVIPITIAVFLGLNYTYASFFKFTEPPIDLKNTVWKNDNVCMIFGEATIVAYNYNIPTLASLGAKTFYVYNDIQFIENNGLNNVEVSKFFFDLFEIDKPTYIYQLNSEFATDFIYYQILSNTELVVGIPRMNQMHSVLFFNRVESCKN